MGLRFCFLFGWEKKHGEVECHKVMSFCFEMVFEKRKTTDCLANRWYFLSTKDDFFLGLKRVCWARFEPSPNGEVIGGIISHRIHVTGICSPTFSCLSAEN